MTKRLISVEAAWLRVPMWSLWYPLCVLPGFVFFMLRRGAWRRLLQAECWENMGAMYLIGLDGWGNDD